MMIIKYTRRPVHYAHVKSEAHTTTSQPDMYSSGVDLIPLRSILVSCLSSSSEIRAISRLLQYTHSSPNQWLNGNKTRVPGIQVCADFNNKTIIINTHEPIDWWPTWPRRTTYLGLGDVVSRRLDHGKVALADGLLDFIVSDPEQFIHGGRGCGAPELLWLLLGTPAGDQRVVLGHRVAGVSRDGWDWILWVVNSANDNTWLNLSFSTWHTWTGQDPMVSFPDPGFYPAIRGTIVLHLFGTLIALKSCMGLVGKGI